MRTEPILRTMAQPDLSAVATIHLAAFPESALTTLGHEAVRRYYEWLLVGPHEAVNLVACDGQTVTGFCCGGIFRGAMSGFLDRNRIFLFWSVLKKPWLLGNPIFRERFSLGVRILKRKNGHRKNAASQSRSAVQPPFSILAIAVHPDHHRRGLGKILMAASEQVARERGFDIMSLAVATDNEGAQCFYENLGWHRPSSDGEWQGKMVKKLSSSR